MRKMSIEQEEQLLKAAREIFAEGISPFDDEIKAVAFQMKFFGKKADIQVVVQLNEDGCLSDDD